MSNRDDSRKLSNFYLEKAARKQLDQAKELYEKGGSKRVDLLHEKISAITREILTNYHELVANKGKLDQFIHDKNVQENDLIKERETRQRLEKLCKMLQTKNQQIIDQSNAAIQNQNETRQQIRQEYQEKLQVLSDELQANSDRRTRIVQEHERLRGSLQKMVTEVEANEESYKTQLEELDAKLQALQSEMSVEDTEEQSEIKQKIDSYKEQFEDFQKRLVDSHSEFQKYRTMMPTLGKMYQLAEKKCQNLKKKEDQSKQVILDMDIEIEKIQEAIAQTERQKNQLKEMIAKFETEV